jgi:hypothetical protein
VGKLRRAERGAAELLLAPTSNGYMSAARGRGLAASRVRSKT